MSTEEMSGDEQEVNEIARGKRWEMIQVIITKDALISIITITVATNNNNSDPRENRQVKQWTQKPRDLKITLTQESDHYVPTEFSGNFFRKIRPCHEA